MITEGVFVCGAVFDLPVIRSVKRAANKIHLFVVLLLVVVARSLCCEVYCNIFTTLALILFI